MLNSAAKKPAPSSSVALFARNFFKCPSMIGSVVPSSKFLVKDLMAEVDWDRARVLVEFGPGVGTITREILKRMRPDAVLIVIELNQDFVEFLTSTIADPRLRMVKGSAADVRRIIFELGFPQADFIISCIPLSIMPEAVREQIVLESRYALKPNGALLGYQYNRTILPCLKSSFTSVKLNFQFFNILPALIFHCTP